jgi:cytochrome c biogenesis protein CcmG, thiol:disulfide interchange protein DsbE
MFPSEAVPRRRWVWPALLATLGGLGVGLWVWFGHAPVGPTPPGGFSVDTVLVGTPAPDFVLPLLSQRAAASPGTLALHTLRGRPVVLNFWASWCAPCRAEMPLLVRTHGIYRSRGVEFVGVDVEDEAADARHFMAQYHIDFPVVHATDQRIVAAYRLLGLPTTIIIGADGVIRHRELGGFIGPEGEKRLVRGLESLLRSDGR